MDSNNFDDQFPNSYMNENEDLFYNANYCDSYSCRATKALKNIFKGDNEETNEDLFTRGKKIFHHYLPQFQSYFSSPFLYILALIGIWFRWTWIRPGWKFGISRENGNETSKIMPERLIPEFKGAHREVVIFALNDALRRVKCSEMEGEWLERINTIYSEIIRYNGAENANGVAVPIPVPQDRPPQPLNVPARIPVLHVNHIRN